ncbi:MAG: hypothetical protein SGILL_002843 [Bacillariaceae sp.]
MSGESDVDSNAKELRRSEIYACCKQLQQQWSLDGLEDLENVHDENDDDGDDDDDAKKTTEAATTATSDPSTIVSSTMLTETLVPAMRDLLSQNEQARNKNEDRDTDDDKAMGNGAKDLEENAVKKDKVEREEYMEAILECLAGFVAASDTNNLSQLREQKDAFVASGAFEMTMHVLRQFLEDFKNVNSPSPGRDEWKAAASDDIHQMLSGMEEPEEPVNEKIGTTDSKIPPIVLTILAHLTENASDELKKDRVLPLLQLVHNCMGTFLADATVQGFGCWILHNLSNPLLQELVAAGSMSVAVSSMKCHPADPLVQEHCDAALYNLLPLVLNCNSDQRMAIAPTVYREISSLIPSLSAVVLRGMEQNANNFSVQQYGLLVLNRICQKDNDHYEVFISEGGLTVLLNSLKMTTTKTFNREDSDGIPESDETANSMIEKRDCLAQLACQFVRDLSRPTNSSMDIVRIIAIKGGIPALIHLLDHYNTEASSLSKKGKEQNIHAMVNVVDPAMACLRNLFCHTENIREAMADNHDNHRVIPTVLSTMDCFPDDAAVQAYGCDCMGRLSQVEGARREITNTIAAGVGYVAASSTSTPESDAMLTVLRAMKNHRTHAGVQERSIVLLWVLVVHDTRHSSSLISRLREVHNELQQKSGNGDMVTTDFVLFLEDSRVTPKGIERLEELVDAIEKYEQGKVPVAGNRASTGTEKENGANVKSNIRNYLVSSWSKLRQGETS